MKVSLKKFIVCLIPWVIFLILTLVKNFYGDFIQGKFLPCWFNLTTGYQCAGCGGTRSFFSLMNGDIVSSFRYNAFVPCAVIFGIIIYVRTFFKIVLGKNIHILPQNDTWIYIPLIVSLMYFVLRNFI
ncbi:MAG: DUF2752 domain-containing protein [Oscillospiraceae bacterium]